MARIDQPKHAEGDEQKAGADLDLTLPLGERQQHRERQQHHQHGQEMTGRQRHKRSH
jgi:hypothetical protein